MTRPARTRTEIARSAADALSALTPERLAQIEAVVGFDGFVDSIIHVVDKRHSMKRDDFNRIGTIPEFAARCGAAAGRSANIEMVVQDVRFGGNGPLFSSAMGRLGVKVSYIGAVGQAEAPESLDPVFQPFVDRCRTVIPICSPGRTDALEFEDGKIMFGKTEPVQAATWNRVKEVVGIERLIAMYDTARLISVVNWTLCGGVEGIWAGLRDEVLPHLSKNPQRRMFVDLSDPAKRTDEDIRRAMGMLSSLQPRVPVTLGLNLAESGRIAKVMGVEAYDDEHNRSLTEMVPEAAERIRRRLGLECVVIHQHTGAGASDDTGEIGWFTGPYTRKPRISTGAGDHFGGGFSFARCAGLGLLDSLAAACGVAGAYVRDAQSPTLERLVKFLGDLPSPE